MSSTTKNKRLESSTKGFVKKMLAKFPPEELWYNMPVPFGYGSSIVDFVGCCRGWFFIIETKRPKGGHTMGRQVETMRKVHEANGLVFFAADQEDVDAIGRILERLPTLVRPIKDLCLQIQNVDTTTPN